MSAQSESMVKRMQHGFAVRNGLFAALLAKGGYKGIGRVFEREYGGFLNMFGQKSRKEPPFLANELTKDLGETWKLEKIVVKVYASMGATHAAIDCVRALQEKHPDLMKDVGDMSKIKIEMAESSYKHGGWKGERPLAPIGAQMNTAYVAACQIVDGQVLPAQFSKKNLDRDAIWSLVDKTECVHNPEMDHGPVYQQRATVEFRSGRPSISELIEAPRGAGVPTSNEDVLAKRRHMTQGVIDVERRDKIEKMILNLEDVDDITSLVSLLAGKTANAID